MRSQLTIHEVEDFDAEIDRLMGETILSARNASKMAVEAHQKGLLALAELDQQDEQLDHVETELDKIEKNVIDTRTRMRSLYGLLRRPRRLLSKMAMHCYPTRKPKLNRDGDEDSDGEEEDDGWTPYQAKRHPSLYYLHDAERRLHLDEGERIVPRLTQDDLKEDVIAEEAKQIAVSVRSLRSVAADMNAALEMQAPKVERVREKLKANGIDVRRAHATARELNAS